MKEVRNIRKPVLIYGDDEESEILLNYIKKKKLNNKLNKVYIQEKADRRYREWLAGPTLFAEPGLTCVGFDMIKWYLETRMEDTSS
jgi:hypothetical protein